MSMPECTAVCVHLPLSICTAFMSMPVTLSMPICAHVHAIHMSVCVHVYDEGRKVEHEVGGRGDVELISGWAGEEAV